MTSKENEVIAKVREKKPDLTLHEEERIRRSVRSIEANPHVCKKCWSGEAYLDGKLICDCWSDAELTKLELLLTQGAFEKHTIGDVVYYTTKNG